MKVYTILYMIQDEYDGSVDLKKLGCFANKEKATKHAKLAFSVMRRRYANEINEYSDYEKYTEECEGALYMEADEENGYYCVAFGRLERRETHIISTEEWEVEE